VRPRTKSDELERRLADAHRRLSELERKLETSSLRDSLTGLPVLQAFGRRLDVELERSRRHGRDLALAIVDVDGFRAANISHGRDAGDQILKTVAAVLSRSTRAGDVVTRTSGDEFAVMLPETDAIGASKCFERILLELEAIRVGPLECVSVSVGVADYRRPMSSEGLMAAAGEALERARAAGGGRTVRHSSTCGPADAEAADDAHDGAIAGLAEALAERDRYTGEHSGEVLDLVERVAWSLALDEQEVQRIRYAALLHDIGKVAIPDEILHKPGRLDAREWEVMRQHPVIGERILRAIPGLGSVARIVRHEHERYDGAGYPDGLKGDEIPIGARIILACDAYHAMVSDRPYRPALSHAAAIRELARHAGSQFDPNVTEVLIGCLYGSGHQPVAA
jgi:diguanylate cyclase (GGDEF)-like protein